MKAFKFFAISILVVVIAASGIHFLAVFLSPKTATFVIPDKSQYKIGEIFPMKMEIRNIKTSVNAVQTDIGFDSKRVEIVDISTKDSFANVFIQKEINNNDGWARLTGGLPNPGYFSDSGGLFATVYFKAKSAGLTEIKFLPSSLVLANDGKGTNVLKDFPSASYLIVPEKISKEEEDKQKKLLSDTSVLGASTQLVFFNEDAVLGSSSDDSVIQNKSFFDNFVETLVKIDNFIVSGFSFAFSFN